LRQILHISDVHFGPPHVAEVAAGVLALIERRRPDLVAISGDLTQRAKPRQFRSARAFVDRIPVPTLAVPGNHDVPLYRFWERALYPYGAYRRHFSPELEPVVREEDLVVAGINTSFNWTTKHGRIRPKRLRQVAELFASVEPSVVKIVVLHHQLTPPPRFGSQRVARNARRAVELFAELGVDLVLAGHMHRSWIAISESFYPHAGRPFPILHSGTTTSDRGRGNEHGRCTANWIRIDEDEMVLSHLGWRPDLHDFEERSRHRYPRGT
jgi:3',5'-cyclic AMP phosphodiesterase CpdA